MKERSQRRRPVPHSVKMSSSEFQPKEQRRFFVWPLSEGGVRVCCPGGIARAGVLFFRF